MCRCLTIFKYVSAPELEMNCLVILECCHFRGGGGASALRLGVGTNADHTLEDVGQQFRVTRERIRQIEAKALRKLKHPSRSRKLRSFLGS